MREKIVVGNIYHVLNRGVDKRDIFMDDRDYLRFIHDLFEFNDANPINNNFYLFKNNVIARPYIGVERKPRKLLVELLVFALMPNHYHLLLRPLVEDGVRKFMKRLNMGYARYFNDKYERSGALFQGRFKSVAVTRETHFIHLPYYIHLNPLDIAAPEWRERKIKSVKHAVEFLEQYRWSSFPDYIGKKNFPSVTQRDFLLAITGGVKGYKKDMLRWLEDLEVGSVSDVSLESI